MSDDVRRDVRMLRPDLRDLPKGPLPDGFRLRPLRGPEEGRLWEQVVRAAETEFEVADGLFAEQYGHDLAGTRERVFFLEAPDGTAVGTISAWYQRAFKGGEWGRIHWVAVVPEFQGRGLGRGMLAFALRELARHGHDRAYLSTSTARLPALSLYLRFGFVPDPDTEDAAQAWQGVAERLPAAREAVSRVFPSSPR